MYHSPVVKKWIIKICGCLFVLGRHCFGNKTKQRKVQIKRAKLNSCYRDNDCRFLDIYSLSILNPTEEADKLSQRAKFSSAYFARQSLLPTSQLIEEWI